MQSPSLNFSPRGLYIGGRWISPAEGKSFASINPSNMEKLADIPAAGEADVDAAVQAAKAAFKEWSRVPIKERARCLELLADRIEENADELALLDAVDSGNAIVGMRGDMIWTADWLRYCAGLVTEIKGETFSQGDASSQSHAAAAIRRRRQDQSVQPSVPVLRRESGGAARGGQHRRDQGFGAGAAFKPAARRTVRRNIPRRRGQYPRRRWQSRFCAGASSGCAAHRLCRIGADRPHYRAGGRGGSQAREPGARRQESDRHFPGRRS